MPHTGRPQTRQLSEIIRSEVGENHTFMMEDGPDMDGMFDRFKFNYHGVNLRSRAQW